MEESSAKTEEQFQNPDGSSSIRRFGHQLCPCGPSTGPVPVLLLLHADMAQIALLFLAIEGICVFHSLLMNFAG